MLIICISCLVIAFYIYVMYQLKEKELKNKQFEDKKVKNQYNQSNIEGVNVYGINKLTPERIAVFLQTDNEVPMLEKDRFFQEKQEIDSKEDEDILVCEEKVCSKSKEPIIFKFFNNYTVIDIETTGFNFRKDQIVEVSALRIRNNKIVDTYQAFNKESTLSEFLENNSPITNEDIEKGLESDILLKNFLEFIGKDILIGHKIGFDLNFIRTKLHLHGLGDLSNEYVDTMLIGKYYANKDMSSHKVEDYIREYPNQIMYDHLLQHSAFNDVNIEYRIYNIQRNILGEKWSVVLDDKIFNNIKWALPEVKIIESKEDRQNRASEYGNFMLQKARRISTVEGDYKKSNEILLYLLDEYIDSLRPLFAEEINNESDFLTISPHTFEANKNKVYRVLIKNYQITGDYFNVIKYITRWKNEISPFLNAHSTKWAKNILEDTLLKQADIEFKVHKNYKKSNELLIEILDEGSYTGVNLNKVYKKICINYINMNDSVNMQTIIDRWLFDTRTNMTLKDEEWIHKNRQL